jgi:protein pelota
MGKSVVLLITIIKNILKLNIFQSVKHVEKANEAEAIDTLLISDSLFRSKELSERKRYVNIVDYVKENGGQVRIFSSLHVSGERNIK